MYEKLFPSSVFDTWVKRNQPFNVMNSDIKLKTGFGAKLFEFATCSKTGLTFNKILNLRISVLFQMKL